MKQATRYAKKVKTFLNRLRRMYGPLEPAAPIPPIEQLLIGILQEGTTLVTAQAAFRRIIDGVVDLNELRVSPHYEIIELMGDSIPRAAEKAPRILSALRMVYEKEHVVNLDRLKGMTAKDSRAYLDRIEALDAHTKSAILLLSLGCTAMPVDDETLAMLKDEELVAASADAADVQAFLERYIPAGDAMTFYRYCRRYLSERVQEEKPPPPKASPKTKTAKRAKEDAGAKSGGGGAKSESKS